MDILKTIREPSGFKQAEFHGNRLEENRGCDITEGGIKEVG